MKIGIFGIDSIQAGKANVKDERVDALAKMFNSGRRFISRRTLSPTGKRSKKPTVSSARR